MSIKTIGQETRSTSLGLEKKINDGAKKLVIDILQATQYSTPIPSTIRELVTNACDSQREKEIAISILTGKSKVEDYFITRDGEEYEDSNFNPEYYDLDWLSDESDVIIEYHEDDEGTGYCDTVKVIDYGVGIGKRRLEGMLELGYSTKRNTSENFGAFGLGSKVALSTGVPFYTIETHYNGRMFKLNCHPYKTDFIINKFEADGSIELSNGTKAYYKNTISKNKTIVSFGVKRHNRSLFVDSVNQQLTYFSNVKFVSYFHGSNYPYDRAISREPLLNTKTMIISDGAYYSRPHIVLVKNAGDEIGINYGSIDFRELEMEQLYGNVGIKCPARQAYIENGVEVVVQDGVEVTPSREKVIWSDHTRKYVQRMIEEAADEASELIESELKQDDFGDWIKTCANILYKGSKNVDEIANAPAIAQISRLVDTSNIKPKFKTTGIRFASPKKLLTGLRLRRVHTGSNGRVIREDCNDWTTVSFDRLYFTTENANQYKDLYLTSGSDPIFLLTPRSLEEKEDYERSETILELIENSSVVKSYDDVDVPESYIEDAKRIEESEDAISHVEYRKLNNKIVAHTLRWGRLKNDWVWDKFEPRINEMVESEVTTFYGSRKEDAVKLKTAAWMLSGRIPTYPIHSGNYYDDYHNSPVLIHEWGPELHHNMESELKSKTYNSPQIIGLAQANIKHAESNPNWRHIDDFFYTMDLEGNITASEYLKLYLTYKATDRKSYDWMSNQVIKYFFPDLHDLYYRYSKFFSYSPRLIVTNEIKEFVNYLHQFIDYQKVCDLNDVSLREQKSREIFVVDVPSIDAYDRDLVSNYDVFKEFAEGIQEFMREYMSATSYITSENVRDVFKVIFTHYGKFDIEVPEISVPEARYSFETKDTSN